MNSHKLTLHTLGVLTALSLVAPPQAVEAQDRTFAGSNGRVLLESPPNASVNVPFKTWLFHTGNQGRTLFKDEVRAATFSPNGNKIAYYNPNNRRIYVSNVDGTGAQAIVPAGPAGSVVINLYWAPDGNRMAFVRTNPNSFAANIYVATSVTSSTAPTQLTTDGTSVNPSWANDSTTLAYQSQRDGDWEIYLQQYNDFTGGAVQKITNNDIHDTSPSWAPNGSGLAYASGSSTYNMRVRYCPTAWFLFWMVGSPVTIGETSAGIYAGSIHWAPDSSKLLALYAVDGPDKVAVLTPPFMGMFGDWTENVLAPGVFSDAVWSPDSRKILFRHDDGWDVSLMNSNGSGVQRLSTDNYSIRSYQSR